MKLFLRIAAALFLLTVIAAATFYWNPIWCSDQQLRYHLWRSGVRSKYIYVGGNRIHYFEAVPPDGAPGKPLLLVHGLGARGEDWSPMIPSLAAAGFHVYAPDLLGYGRSDKPGSVVYSVATEEAVMIGLMQATGLAHANLDGWSMGGWIAAKIALDHPGMVDRLVLDDSAGLTYIPSFPRDAFVPTDPASLNRLFALLTPRPPALPDFAVRATLRRIARNGRIIQQSMDTMESGRDLLDTRLAHITQPTLIVWGTEDKLIPITVGKSMHYAIPNSVFLSIDGCGHLAPAECPKPVLAGTVNFLKAEPPTSRGDFTLPGDSPKTASAR